MTTKEFIEKAQIQFGKLNNAYHELRKIYEFYDKDIWKGFEGIPSYEAEETLERFASIVPGMSANTLYCIKMIFDWIDVAKNQVKPIDPKYTLPKEIELGKQYRIISPTKDWFELYIEDGSVNLNLAATLHKLEKIVREWEAFIRTQKQQVELLCYRMGM